MKLDFKAFLMEAKFQATGILRYSGDDRLALEIDGDLAKYYRSLLPKYVEIQSQAYKPHVTVVRTGIENPTNPAAWKKHEGEKVPFMYEGRVYYDSPYFYLKARSDRLEDIREELGLERVRPGYKDFHITIGNTKNLQEPRTFPETRMRYDGGGHDTVEK